MFLGALLALAFDSVQQHHEYGQWSMALLLQNLECSFFERLLVDRALFFGIYLRHLGGPTFLKSLQLQYPKPAPDSFIATQALSQYHPWNPVSRPNLTLPHFTSLPSP